MICPSCLQNIQDSRLEVIQISEEESYITCPDCYNQSDCYDWFHEYNSSDWRKAVLNELTAKDSRIKELEDQLKHLKEYILSIKDQQNILFR